MAKVYEFIANGSEEIEALTVVDVLRRGGVEIVTVSINDTEEVELSHGVVMKCDTTIAAADFSDADMLLLPGGLPGTYNLRDCEAVRAAVKSHYDAGKKVGAICAAPIVLGSLGILEGKKATCYPGCEEGMTGAEYTHELVTVDGNIVTGEGPAATLPYAYTILGLFADEATVNGLKEGMMYNHLLSK